LVETGGGRHFYFSLECPMRTSHGFRPGLELLADGALVVAPPSQHVSGKTYRILSAPDAPIAALPSWLAELAKAGRRALENGALNDAAPRHIPKGNRNEALLSLAGAMRHRGASAKSIEAALLEENRERCHPPLAESEVRKIAESSSRYSPEPRKRTREASEPQGQGIKLQDPEPWPEPVSGDRLLDEIAATLRRYVVLQEGAAAAISLWVVLSHMYQAITVLPLLALVSPEKQCGKTTALAVIGALVPRPLPASNVTPAALFRTIEKYKPTLLIDEADTFLKDNDELRGVLNCGHTRSGAYVLRTVGDNHEPRQFSTWAPKCIGQIGHLSPTLQDRAIVVPFKRRIAAEKIEQLRLDRLEELEPIRRRAARWARDHADSLKSADPVMPEGLNNRAEDNWRALLAIADLAGEQWAKEGRRAALVLARGAREADAAPGIQLLADLRDLFHEKRAESLSSEAITKSLGQLEDRPWPEWAHGKPLSARQLARLLKPFGIAPRKIRTSAGPCQGYVLEEFRDAFARYLPRDPEHAEQPAAGAAATDIHHPEQASDVPDRESAQTTRQSRAVPDVPDPSSESAWEIPSLADWDLEINPWNVASGPPAARENEVPDEASARPEIPGKDFGTDSAPNDGPVGDRDGTP
jgi:putative DNA primase/helicase